MSLHYLHGDGIPEPSTQDDLREFVKVIAQDATPEAMERYNLDWPEDVEDFLKDKCLTGSGYDEELLEYWHGELT